MLRGLIISLLLAGPAQAQSGPTLSGQIDFGFRSYPEAGLFAGQSAAGTGFFIGAEVNGHLGLGDGDVTLQFRALGDDRDGRSGLSLTKAHYTRVFDAWDLLVGYNVENWGVAESRSVLNVINPVDGTDLGFGQDQIGTPMINANFATSLGTISAYALVGFVQPKVPGRNTRARAPWPTFNSRAVFQEGNGRNLDVALRFSNNYTLGQGAVDIAASYFNGTSRTAVGLPGCGQPSALVPAVACDTINAVVLEAYENGALAGTSSQAIIDQLAGRLDKATLRALSSLPSVGFIPYYQKVQNFGLSAVYARGDLQLRVEGAYRKPKGENGSFAAVVGGDYSWSGFAGGDGTLTLAVEYLYDGRDARQPAAIFDNDMFLGLNFLMNDTRDTRLQLGGFYDLDTHAQLYQFGLSTRLNDHVRAELSASHARTTGFNDPLAFLGDDTFIELKFSAYF
ncbi:MAG: hypothetical protein LJE68_03095 [Rhodobacter sp.]|nr:hypothetical protein [Rhodobacter sp.]